MKKVLVAAMAFVVGVGFVVIVNRNPGIVYDSAEVVNNVVGTKENEYVDAAGDPVGVESSEEDAEGDILIDVSKYIDAEFLESAKEYTKLEMNADSTILYHDTYFMGYVIYRGYLNGVDDSEGYEYLLRCYDSNNSSLSVEIVVNKEFEIDDPVIAWGYLDRITGDEIRLSCYDAEKLIVE